MARSSELAINEEGAGASPPPDILMGQAVFEFALPVIAAAAAASGA
jgi:hypothetical protein